MPANYFSFHYTKGFTVIKCCLLWSGCETAYNDTSGRSERCNKNSKLTLSFTQSKLLYSLLFLCYYYYCLYYCYCFYYIFIIIIFIIIFTSKCNQIIIPFQLLLKFWLYLVTYASRGAEQPCLCNCKPQFLLLCILPIRQVNNTKL